MPHGNAKGQASINCDNHLNLHGYDKWIYQPSNEVEVVKVAPSSCLEVAGFTALIGYCDVR